MGVKILGDAVQKEQGIAVFEAQERTLISILQVSWSFLFELCDDTPEFSCPLHVPRAFHLQILPGPGYGSAHVVLVHSISSTI
jgi:hypothetical protein